MRCLGLLEFQAYLCSPPTHRTTGLCPQHDSQPKTSGNSLRCWLLSYFKKKIKVIIMATVLCVEIFVRMFCCLGVVMFFLNDRVNSHISRKQLLPLSSVQLVSGLFWWMWGCDAAVVHLWTNNHTHTRPGCENTSSCGPNLLSTEALQMRCQLLLSSSEPRGDILCRVAQFFVWKQNLSWILCRFKVSFDVLSSAPPSTCC